MIGQDLAAILGIIIIGVLILTDIWFAIDSLKGNTYSELVRTFSKHTLFVPWSLAVLLGHWFHPVDNLQPVFGGASIWILIGLTVVLTVVGCILGFSKRLSWPAWPWVASGLVAGTLLWPV